MIPSILLLAGLAQTGAVTLTFDGANLDGWRAGSGVWSAENGAIVHPDPHFNGGALVLADHVLGDCDVALEAAFAETYWDKDSVWLGVMVRARDPLARGYTSPGCLAAIRANGEVFLNANGQSAGPPFRRDKRADQGRFHLRVTAKGGDVRILLDGEEVLSAKAEDPSVGQVALVNFGCVAAFSNIAISGVPAQPAAVVPVTQAKAVPRPAQPVTPLPRIGVKKLEGQPAEFMVRDTGARFLPIGFNHTVLGGARSWHALFNEGTFDLAALDQVLAGIAAAGGDCIRFWAWGYQGEGGFTGAETDRGLNPTYMENFTAFLRAATRHGVYVIPVLDETPHNAWYDQIAETAGKDDDPRVTGYNRQYLCQGLIASKAAAVRDFVQFVKDADPGLLNTVLGWSFANEMFVVHDAGPFLMTEGIARTVTGKNYDMATKEGRQACYDESVTAWANQLSAAVREVDPEALTTAGMWTADAHGREAFSGLLPDDRDPRRPPRPSVMAGPDSGLSFIDVHIYPWDGTSKVRPDTHEIAEVIKSGKPAIVGEYGAFKDKDITTAKRMMNEMVTQAHDMGYRGFLHWVWDMRGVKGQTWSSVEEGLADYLVGVEKAWK